MKTLAVPGRQALLPTAAVLALHALAVMSAWYLQATAVLQWDPSHAPAQFNAALGLLLCAAGLAALRLGGARPATACGVAAALLGLASGAQYLLPFTLGIDALLFDPYLTVQTSTPGRMAPNAALCLALAGAALAGLGLRRGAAFGAVAALAASAIALVAASGYLSGADMAYGWGAATRLDLPSALSFTLLGACLAWCWAPAWRDHALLHWLRLPVLVFACVATATCVIWLALANAERAQLRSRAAEDMRRLAGAVAGPVAADLRMLEHMRARLDLRPDHDAAARQAWRADAAAIVRDAGMLSAVLRVDSARRVQWAAPALPALAGADLGAGLDALAALEHARIRGRVTLTHVTPLAGGEGVLAVLPLAAGGFVAGIIDVNRVARALAASPYAIELYDGEQKLYSRGADAGAAPDLIQEGEVRLRNIGWRLRLWPSALQQRAASSWLPATVLAAGLCMALLLASISLLVQLSAARARTLQREIAERIKVEQENALLASELEVLFANVVVGIALIRDGRTVRCNAQYARLLGAPAETLAGQPLAPHHPAACIGADHPEQARALAERGACEVELELQPPNGAPFWAACFGKALDPRDPAKGTVWVVEEISARKQAEEELLFQARHDALTGLANRAMFAKRLDLAIAAAAREQRQMAVCYIDLDKFKYVNDSFGHDAGDHLLLTTAHRLSGSVRDSDTVARLGGDEFALVLSGAVDRAILTTVLDRIHQHLQEELSFNGHRFAVSGSIGMAIYPDHGLDAATLLKHADEAMYRAKQAGRNNWKIWEAPAPSMRAGAPDRLDGAGADGGHLAAEQPDRAEQETDGQERQVEG